MGLRVSQSIDLEQDIWWGWLWGESSVQLLNCVQLCANPWTAACQTFLSIYQFLELAQTHVHRVGDAIQTYHPTSFPSSPAFNFFPASGTFPRNQFFTSGGQSIEVSASASVYPMNNQDRFPLGWTVWISLKSRGLSRVFSSTTVQKHQFFSAQLSLFSPTLTSTHDYWKNHSFD